MKQLYTLLLLALLSVTASAQNTDWKTPEDYLRDTAQVAQTIRWLEQTPFPANYSEREKKAQYAYKWLEGAPYTVSVEGIFLQPIMEDKRFAYKDMVVPQFIFGQGLYLIESNGKKDALQANLRGIESMVILYRLIKEKDKLAKNKTLEKLESLMAKNTLEAYVKKQLKL